MRASRTICLGLALLGLFASQAQAAPPALDSGGTPGHAGYQAANTGSAVFTTLQTNDVIIVFDSYENPTNVDCSPGTTMLASGLTFTRRGHWSTTQGGGLQTVDEWWAPASTTQSSATVTVSHAASCASLDAGVIVAFGVHGVNNISAPFDTNAGALAAGLNSTNAAQPSVNVTTSQANDFLISAGYAGVNNGQDTSSWSTVVFGFNNLGAVNFSNLIMFGNAVTATQSAAAVPFTYSANTINIRTVDALTADASGGGPTSTHQSLTLLGVQ